MQVNYRTDGLDALHLTLYGRRLEACVFYRPAGARLIVLLRPLCGRLPAAYDTTRRVKFVGAISRRW